MNLHNEMTIRQLVESNVSKDKSFKGLDCTFDWALLRDGSMPSRNGVKPTYPK